MANGFAFSSWNALHTNFAVDVLGFGGREQGILHTVREIPGFLAFAAVFLLLVMREQTLGILSVLTIGIGVAITGFFPDGHGLLRHDHAQVAGLPLLRDRGAIAGAAMVRQANAPSRMGRIYSYASMSTIAAYGLIFFTWKWLHLDFNWVFLAGGLVATAIGLLVWLAFPRFEER